MSSEHERRSIAYREGVRARNDGIKLKDSAIKNLRIGSKQYDDYLAGYDSIDAAKAHDHSQEVTEEMRAPLPPGAVIEHCGERGEVIRDPGGEGRVTVRIGDHQAKWWWTFEGVSCSVVSIPNESLSERNPLRED